VLLLDMLERQTLADRHVAAVLVAAGAKDVTLPSLHEKRQQFDEALAAEPVPVAGSQISIEQQELRQVLGVA
jgi:hypothetical protein